MITKFPPAELTAFDAAYIGLSKGSLSLALILTRNAKSMSFPLDKAKFLTAKGGQVAGLGGGAVKRILNDHGIERILSNEGGRTSRGNMDRMNAYIDLLNKLYDHDTLDLDKIERYWIERTQAYFDALPFSFRLSACESDPSLRIEFEG